jgi:hypothetical protein
MRTFRLFAVALLVIVAGGCNVAAAEDIDTSGGMSAARAWLALVDGARYGESWDTASERFRSAMERVKWEATIQAARGPLGVTLSRKVRTVAFTHSLPGAPEGDYVVVQFDTRFANGAQSIETVTAEREKDGAWRISGYWIR